MALNACDLCTTGCRGQISQDLLYNFLVGILCKISAAVHPENRSASSVITEAPVTVLDTSTEILPDTPTRKGGELRVPVTSVVPIFISFGGPATLSSRQYEPGDPIPLEIGGCLYTGAVYGIVASGSQIIEVTEL